MKSVKSVLVTMLLVIMAIQVAWASMIDDLINSSYKGDLEQVKSLLEQGVNVNVANKNGDTAFIKAVMGGHFEVADYLISNGAYINILNIVAEKGSIEMARYLVDKGVKIYGENLTVSIENGNLEIAKYLIEKDNNIISFVTLITAIENGYADIAKQLIQKSPKNPDGSLKVLFERGYHLQTIRDRQGRSALSYALAGGMLEIAKMLMDNRLIVTSDDLNIALKNGHFEIVKYFIEEELQKTGSLRYEKQKLLQTAVEKGNLELVKLLVENGAKVYNGGYEETILMLASGKGYLDIVKYLLSKGAYIDNINDTGMTALTYAIKNKQLEVAKYLINYGANIDDANLIIVAAESGYTEMVKLLVDNGANVNSVGGEIGRERKTALLLASEAGNLEMVKLLTAKGADINATNFLKQTTLIVATINGQLEVVKYLVSLKGIKLNARDFRNGTALMYAELQGNKEIMKVLLKAGAD